MSGSPERRGSSPWPTGLRCGAANDNVWPCGGAWASQRRPRRWGPSRAIPGPSPMSLSWRSAAPFCGRVRAGPTPGRAPPTMSAAATSATGIGPMVAAMCSFNSDLHCCSVLPVGFQLGRCRRTTSSIACAKVTACLRRGSRPSWTACAFASARSRARAREVAGKEPNPMDTRLPPTRRRCAQVLDHRPLAVALTSRLNPWEPRPSP